MIKNFAVFQWNILKIPFFKKQPSFKLSQLDNPVKYYSATAHKVDKSHSVSQY